MKGIENTKLKSPTGVPVRRNGSATLPPLRDGEARCVPENGHNDVRNDGDLCFAHPGITWCETCGALYGTERWKDGCKPNDKALAQPGRKETL